MRLTTNAGSSFGPYGTAANRLRRYRVRPARRAARKLKATQKTCRAEDGCSSCCNAGSPKVPRLRTGAEAECCFGRLHKAQAERTAGYLFSAWDRLSGKCKELERGRKERGEEHSPHPLTCERRLAQLT